MEQKHIREHTVYFLRKLALLGAGHRLGLDPNEKKKKKKRNVPTTFDPGLQIIFSNFFFFKKVKLVQVFTNSYAEKTKVELVQTTSNLFN